MPVNKVQLISGFQSSKITFFYINSYDIPLFSMAVGIKCTYLQLKTRTNYLRRKVPPKGLLFIHKFASYKQRFTNIDLL